MTQYKWSESGLNLLNTITNAIAQSGGSGRLANLINREQTSSYTCNKKECAYCNRVTVNYTAEMPEHLIILDKPIIKRTRMYSLEEITILKQNDHLPPKMLSFILNRSVNSIKCARSKFVRSNISKQYRVSKFRF